jgi:hypothetical protein
LLHGVIELRSHNDRILAAASRMRTRGPAAQSRRRFAGQTRLRRPAQSRRASQLERHAFAPAIALGRFTVGKAKLDLCERIATAGPSGQRIDARTPAFCDRSRQAPAPARPA